MIDSLVRSTLGEFGSQLLDLYLANSLWINALLLLYAFVIVLGRRNYWRIIKILTNRLVEQNASAMVGKHPKQIETILKRNGIPWKAALNASIFPFISPPGKYYPSLVKQSILEKYFTPEILANSLANHPAIQKSN